MREHCGIVDLSAFAIFDVIGPGALDAVQSLAVAQLDVRPGRVVYTSLLNDAGGFVADLTIMRLGPQRFRVVTGGATGMMDLKWFADHLPARHRGHRPDLGVDHDRPVGPDSQGRARHGDPRRRLASRFRLRDLP